jgi:glutathione S-transferase
MKLYGFGPTRSLRALWGLKELDADFEFIPVDLLAGEHKRPDFLRLNPAGKVPVLVDGDLIIPESAAIVLYLADKFREKGLLPADLRQRAQAYPWIMRSQSSSSRSGGSASTRRFIRRTSVCRQILRSRERSFLRWLRSSTPILKGADLLLAIASQPRIASRRILSIGQTNSS